MLPEKLIKEWHPTKNSGLDSNSFSSGSNKKMWWKCPVANDHEWFATINSRAALGRNCPYCAGNRPSSTNNLSIYQGPSFEKILKEWHIERNIKKIEDYVIGSAQKVWWKCSINPNHEWEMQIRKRTERQQGCVYCSGRYASQDNNLTITHPLYAKQFNEKKNGVKASSVLIGQRTKYYWTCSNGHEMFMSPHNRSRVGSNCQQCNKSGVSTLENNLRLALTAYYPKIKQGTSKLHIKWRSNSSLTVDLEGTYRNKSFVVEYDSEYWHLTKVNTKERDYDKSVALLEQGYILIRVREGKLKTLGIDHRNYSEIFYNYKKENGKVDILADLISERIKFMIDSDREHQKPHSASMLK